MESVRLARDSSARVRLTSHQRRLIGTYAGAHGAAEFLAALTLFSLFINAEIDAVQIVVYSVLAFGTPILFAAVLAGRLGRVSEGLVGVVGAILMAAALPLGVLGLAGWASVIGLGLGSALLHLAAGTATLKMPNRGTAVGIFESLGAPGLALGTILGLNDWRAAATSTWAILGAVIMLMAGLAVAAWGSAKQTPGINASSATEPTPAELAAAQAWREIDPAPSGAGKALGKLLGWITGARLPTAASWSLGDGGAAPLIALLALSAISVARALTYSYAPQPWKADAAMVLVASLIIGLGRALGGLMADRMGFAAAAIGSFVVTSVFLGSGRVWAGLVGLFFLSTTMAPVILGLLASTRRPSLAFGLAQLCQVPPALVGTYLFAPPAGAGLAGRTILVPSASFAPGVTAYVLMSCVVLVFIIRPLDHWRTNVAT
ncbi:MAG: hypothetical protein FWF36_01945 [Propionibacteriaceae bacterium]|nr:hypothetical protein [Propionibacteriaceae bacterium]